MTIKIDGTNGVLQAYDYQVLTTGFSYTFAAGTQVLLAVPAGTLATGTVTMPSTPADGMNITITSTQQITALTVNANTGQSIVGGGVIGMDAGGSKTFIYRLANTTWYSQNNNVAIFAGNQGQIFTTVGASTFTIPANVTAIKVTVVAGGGGGGGSTACGASAAGGGGGASLIKYLTGLTPGNTLAVTVGAAGTAGSSSGGNGGAGGTSSVASGTQTITTLTCTGGAAGAGNNGNGTTLGGAATNGDVNVNGGPSAKGDSNGSSGRNGGSSGLQFGSGGAGGNASAAGGAAPTGYGGGGGGAGIGTFAGGVGRQGIVIFEW